MNELKDLAEHLVDVMMGEGADDAVAEVVESSVRQLRYSNSQIDAVNSWTEKHAVVLVAIGKRVLSSDLRDMDGLNDNAKQLVASARRAPISKMYGGIASGRFRYKRPGFDKKILSIEDPSAIVCEAIAGAESEGANNVGGTLFERHERTGIASSGGALAYDENAWLELSVRAFSQPEASGHAVSCTPRLAKLHARETGERAGRLSSDARNPVQGEQGKTDLIIQPMFFGELINSTTDMMSALRVEMGLSMYSKRIGKRVASEEVTFVDDPTIESTSRRSFDHEGVPTRRNVVIKDGVLKMFLHSTSTAKRFKAKTTANAGSLVPTPFTYPTQPVAFHPVVQTGDWPIDEMVSDTAHGLMMNNTWYTRYQNYATGEFSTIPRDAILKIEHGEIVGAVKNIRISDNMMNLWKSIDALSRESEEVYWWDEAAPPSTLPHVRIPQMTVTRSS